MILNLTFWKFMSLRKMILIDNNSSEDNYDDLGGGDRKLSVL